MAENSKNKDYDEPVDSQETEKVKARVTAAENEVFLQDIFGVHLPDDIQAPELAQKISRRVVSVIDQTRLNMTQAQLSDVLDRQIQDRINRAEITVAETGSVTTLTDTQRNRNIRAVVEAMRESINSDAIDDVIQYGLPAFIPENAEETNHIMVLKDCRIKAPDPTNPSVLTLQDRDIQVDTRHPFWREKYAFNPGGTPPVDDIKKALEEALITKGGTLQSLGIKVLGAPPVPESYTFTDTNDLDALLGGKANGIDVTRRYDDINFSPPSAPGVTLHVNTKNLLRHRDSSPTQRLVASYVSPIHLRNTLTSDANSIQDFIMVDPPDALVTPQMWSELSDQIFMEIRGSIGTGPPLALQERELRLTQRELGEQHRFHKALLEDNDN